jgi:5-(carboxyamino)imidazole ribonucleotide synthase
MPRNVSRSKKALAKPIGILGGGQLARMIALKAHEMGLPVRILSESSDDPAAQVASGWVKGSLNERKTLKQFLNSCSLVTFESEFLDASLLSDIARETGTPVYPRPHDMAAMQDRLTQKSLLLKHKLPSANFFPVKSYAEAQKALTKLGGRAVFKKRRFGYDGYGTFVVHSPSALAKIEAEFGSNIYGFIAEQFVPFRREIAVMVGRSQKGQTIRLPFVETYQENSRCLWVKGPLRETSALKTLAHKLELFLKATGYVGIMGIELFDTGRGLLINELAPRVHNSGHYSLNGLCVDQFSLHLKAILGQDLGKPVLTAKGFAMLNLLGHSSRKPSWDLPSDIHLHWYGKHDNRPGRKMGHINALATTPDEALALVKKRLRNFDV